MSNPKEELEIVLKKDGLQSVAVEYGELVLDGVLEDGLLKDIPAVGTIVGLIKFGNSWSKHSSAKKIYKFLFELNQISASDRQSKIDEINESKKYRSTVGEIILELLDKIDSDLKPEILGKLFRGVINEDLSFEQFLRLSHIIKSTFYLDLMELKENAKDGKVSGHIDNDLTLTKLVIDRELGPPENPIPGGPPAEVKFFILSELGNILIDIGMN